jgi:probable HAF family extracellular repeat protein
MMTFLPGLAGGDSQAADIDESGVVVGSAVDALGRSRAVRWVNGVPEDLGTLGGEESAALGMNNVGQVVGMSETEGEPSGFLWSEGELSALPPMPPNPFGWAEDINDQGVAVGSSAGAPTQDATLWIAGVPSKLPSLAFEAGATAVGEDGVVVGGSIPDDQESARGVRWVEGRVEELPTPPEANFSSANDINRLGQIVGHAAGAVIWHGDGYRQIDTVGYGRGINDQGQVVASWLGGIGYSWEPQRSFAARPQRDTVEPPTLRRGRHPPPGLRPSSSGLCRAPPLMSAKVENALRVAGCIE